jgi:uncharacterized DUF497 family protein
VRWADVSAEKVYYLYIDRDDHGPPEFEFDPAKSAANLAKHGIDFEQAQAIWRDEYRSATRARFDGEERFEVVGFVGGKCWTAVITMRERRIRIISVRRSRRAEVEKHGRAQADQR